MPACVLLLSNDSPFRTAIIDKTTRRVRYRIHTPIRVTESFTRIKRFEPRAHPPSRVNQDVGPSFYGDTPYNTEFGGRGVSQPLPEIGEEAARICWKWFESDEITFQGRKTTWRALLPSCGKLGRSFMFTGPDGVQYRWAMGAMGRKIPRLVTTDESKTVIAEYRPGRFWTGKKARLVVQPAGMAMLDYIILTFVFVEHTRRQRERAAKAYRQLLGLIFQ